MSRSKTNLSLSVVIVSFNTRELLRKCLSSIKEKFNDVSYEVIVVDNDSKDGSVEMLRKEFPDVLLIENDCNAGFSRGNNQGIKSATGNYVLIANSDIEIVSNNMKDVLDYMEENPTVGMLGPKIYRPNGDIQTSATAFQSLFSVFARQLGLRRLLPTDSVRKLVVKKCGKCLGKSVRGYLRVYKEGNEPEVVDWVTAAFVLVRAEVFEEVGYWDEDFFMYAEDEDFQLRAHKAGWKAVYYRGFEIIHHVGASGKGNPLVLTERCRSRLIYWFKHHPVWKVLVVRVIMFLSFGLKQLFCWDAGFRKAYWQILKYTVNSVDYIKSHRILGA